MKYSTREEFELHVHKCFGRIFELLTQMDSVIREGADKEEAEGKIGVMNDLRDWVEEVILHCHLAWQYHRLSRMGGSPSTWDRVENKIDGDDQT
ncbi:MAG: hypothetical protein AB1664_00515 [Thermodesulfobacteriota bacterium]